MLSMRNSNAAFAPPSDGSLPACFKHDLLPKIRAGSGTEGTSHFAHFIV
jgi:hypothetical protein